MKIFQAINISFATVLFLLTINLKAQNVAERDWLVAAYQNVYPGGNAFPDLKKWQVAESVQSINAVQALPDSVKEKLINQADLAFTYNWPSLPASLYLDYKLTGARTNYEGLQGERRKILANLVAGELIENKGKYIPQIVNGLWLIMEESTWVAPAHIVVQKEGADLANIENPYIDLSASRTALSIATIYNVLGPKLASYSKVINSRILYELNRRIFDPYLEYDNFWWMGFKGNAVNNWNTYINANTLQAALLVLEPGGQLDDLTAKLLKSTDNFINQYPEDGGCDEGPSYWDMAGGRLIRLMTVLNEASGNKLDWSDKELLHKIGAYTYKMQIADRYVVNFADAAASYSQSPVSVYQYGKMFSDDKLIHFASFLFQAAKQQVSANDISDFLAIANAYNDLKAIPAKAPYPLFSALPNLQVFNARQMEGSTEGLFFAIKGGNNAESHNHNDIGNFIVYNDGQPVLIDVGVGIYTSKTFSNKRYELWNVQSQWHNCPTVNGVQQQDGKEFAAADFKFSNTSNIARASLDIAKAYAASASVNKWLRTMSLNRTKNEIELSEAVVLDEYKAPSELNFLTPKPVKIEKGKIWLAAGLVMAFDDRQLEARVDEQPIDDARLTAAWGTKVYRIRLIGEEKKKVLNYKIMIKQSKK